MLRSFLPNRSLNAPVRTIGRGFLLAILSLLISFGILISTPLFALSSDKNSGFEKVYMTHNEALDFVFPDTDTISSRDIVLVPDLKRTIQEALHRRVPESSITLYTGLKDTTETGYALILEELGKHYPMTFIVGITPQFKVKRVALMVYREKIGHQVRKKRFLKQFFGKRSDSTLAVNQDIINVSGATISSWAMTAGVKKALVITEKVVPYEAQSTATSSL